MIGTKSPGFAAIREGAQPASSVDHESGVYSQVCCLSHSLFDRPDTVFAALPIQFSCSTRYRERDIL